MNGLGENWDLIVAGAGPARCVLAAKVASSGARVLRLQTDGLESSDVDKMIKWGILKADEVYSGMVPERFQPTAGGLLRKVIKGACRH